MYRVTAESLRAVMRTWWGRPLVRWLVGLTVFGFVLRLGWLIAAHPAAVSDAMGYKHLARRWVTQGLYERNGSPTAWRTPGYIALLGAGILISDSDTWLGFLNVLVSATVVPLVGILAWRLGLSLRVSTLAAGFAAVMPPLVLWAPVLGPENLQTPLLLAAMIFLAGRRRYRSTVVSGLLLGLAVLVRPESIVYLPVGILLLLPGPWTVIARRSATLIAVVLLVCAPWLVRNQLEVGPVGLSSVGGVNFYLAHRDSGYGFEPYERTQLGGLEEPEMSRRGYELGLEHLRRNPTAMLGDITEGTVQLYATPRYAPFFSTRGFATEAPYPLGTDRSVVAAARVYSRLGWYFIAALAVGGWILMVCRRCRAAAVLGAFAAANWMCFAVVFWALPRYRFTIEPLLCIAAAYMASAIIHRRHASEQHEREQGRGSRGGDPTDSHIAAGTVGIAGQMRIRHVKVDDAGVVGSRMHQHRTGRVYGAVNATVLKAWPGRGMADMVIVPRAQELSSETVDRTGT